MWAALADAGVEPGAVGLVHLSANGVTATDAAEREALRLVFGRDLPTNAVKRALGENPAIGAIQLAIAAAQLGDDPALGAVVVNGFGAGGNFLTAVLTAV
jgi:3-oxoacyl-(acyl-carrier-protein) synthase